MNIARRILVLAAALVTVSTLAVAGALPVSPAHAASGVLFNNFNIYAVTNGPPNQTTFTLSSSAQITQLETYHWNNGAGATPGYLGLSGNGHFYGWFPAAGASGQGGAPNVAWIANVNLTLSAGTYTVDDSSWSTWSYNSQSQNMGFAMVSGAYTLYATTTTISAWLQGPRPCRIAGRSSYWVFATFTVQNQGVNQPAPTGYVEGVVHDNLYQFSDQYTITPSSSGSATVTTYWGCIPSGSFVINASYTGDALHAASSAPPVTLLVP